MNVESSTEATASFSLLLISFFLFCLSHHSFVGGERWEVVRLYLTFFCCWCWGAAVEAIIVMWLSHQQGLGRCQEITLLIQKAWWKYSLLSDSNHAQLSR